MDVTKLRGTTRLLNGCGFIALMTGLPIFVAYCLYSVLQHGGRITVPAADFWHNVPRPSWEAVGAYLGWLVFQAAMYCLLPGRLEQGQPREDGRRLDYRLNGLKSFLITVGLWATLYLTGLLRGDWIYRHLGELFIAANLVVWPLCLYLYFLGRAQANEVERQMNPLEGFFMGATRNPRNGRFDWKFFCESRPGLTLWVLVALSCAVHQHETFGSVSNSMWLVCFFVTLYVTDYYVVEDAILTTWDIVHEPFGWMLCWGSLVYVPFFYPLAAVWLADHHYVLPPWAVGGILVLGLLGYTIFRQANLQKHRFRKNPEEKIWGREPRFIQTRRGTKLLTSGWWGIASHANYLGDLMLSLAMCMVVGTDSVFGYSYFAVFLPLLLHRDWRDDRHCAEKYGDDWTAYRQRVRWHILPCVY
jgi:delta14-sterol reductase